MKRIEYKILAELSKGKTWLSKLSKDIFEDHVTVRRYIFLMVREEIVSLELLGRTTLIHLLKKPSNSIIEIGQKIIDFDREINILIQD